MKKITTLIATLLIGSFIYGQQAPSGTANPNANWRRGGNTAGGGAPNIFGTMWNSPIYTYTNGINRMTIFGFGTGNAAGRVAMGNNLPANFIARSRLHLHQNSGNTNIRFTNNTIGSLATDGFQVGITKSGLAQVRQRENLAMKFYTDDVERMHLNPTQFTAPPGNGINTSGFLGLNNSNPIFHVDINTPNPAGSTFGELLLRARIEDDPNAYISFVNITTTGSIFSPTLMAKQSDNFHPALNTLGSIVNGQDIATNINPITRFFSAKSYDPAGSNLNLARINVVENRRIFGWFNSIDQLMTMEASGFLGIGTIAPGNRVEINSDFYDQTTGLPLTGANLVDDQTDNNNPGVGAINATGFSGLRFSDLTSNSNPYLDNPGLGVLAVDLEGDIIYVDASGLTGSPVTADNGLTINPTDNVQLGQEVIANTVLFNGPAELLHDSEIPLNGNDLIFSTSNNNSNTQGIERISIGAQPFTPGAPVSPINPQNYVLGASAKLNLFNTTEQTGAHFLTFMDPNNIGFAPDQYSGAKGTVYGLHADKSIIGLLGQGISVITSTRVEGVRGEAFGAGVNIGVRGQSIATGAFSYGGQFVSEPPSGLCLGGESFGIFTRATGSSTSNIGIYATVDGANSCGAADNWAGWFNGDVYVNGILTQASDANLKSNIESLQNANARSIINQLNPVTFNYDNSVNPRLSLPSGLKYGLIAQEVEAVIPEVVYENTLPAEKDSLGVLINPAYSFKTLDYKDFVPMLIANVKDNNSIIDSLQIELNQSDSLIDNLNDRLTQLENCLSAILPALCQMNSMSVESTPEEVQERLQTIIDVELSDKNNIVLNQNVPNPFAERTVITFSIPETVQKAQIHFYDGMGKLINTVDIDDRGNGQINVYANDLSTGVYTYSLVADGKIVATKRMMKQ